MVESTKRLFKKKMLSFLFQLAKYTNKNVVTSTTHLPIHYTHSSFKQSSAKNTQPHHHHHILRVVFI